MLTQALRGWPTGCPVRERPGVGGGGCDTNPDGTGGLGPGQQPLQRLSTTAALGRFEDRAERTSP